MARAQARPAVKVGVSSRARVSGPPPLRVLDSSCWLEFFADTARADLFAQALAQPEHLVVPVVTIYEVAKKLAREAGDEVAAAALSLMQRGHVVPVDLPLALAAVVTGLPLADSLIYATARLHGAELWTQDAHFDGLTGVRYFDKR
jgi:predicted nucleic acid-binding protein